MERLSPKNHIAVVFCILIFSGCSTLAPDKPAFYRGDSYTLEQYQDDLNEYEKPDVQDRRRARDKIIYKVATEIDKAYFEFKDSFFGKRAAGQTTLDIAQIGLSSAGTLAGAGAVNILSAIATGLAGSRLSFDKNFLKEKSTDLLITRMDALRAEQWARINLKLSNDDDIYSFYEAERDLVAYYDKGSLAAAFQNIVAESGAASINADIEIKKQIRRKYGEFIGAPADPEKLKDLNSLYDEWWKLEPEEKETKAKKIIDEFKKSDHVTITNPSGQIESKSGEVAYLNGIAGDEGKDILRETLTQAFRNATMAE